ncbi:MAG: hypothetical protein Q9227_009362 [Pyrenula ochraceoflavens]
MASAGYTAEDLVSLEYDSRGQPITYDPRQSWHHIPLQHPQMHRPDLRRTISPLHAGAPHGFQQMAGNEHMSMGDWQFQSTQPTLNYFPSNTLPYSGTYGVPLQNSPVDLLPAAQGPGLETGLPMDSSFMAPLPDMHGMPFNWQEVHGALNYDASGDRNYHIHSSSPADTNLEVRSLTSSSSNEGWSAIERRSLDTYERGFFVDPNHTVHTRTFSDSSYSDLDQPHQQPPFIPGFEIVPNAVNSPGSESAVELDYRHVQPHRLSIDYGTTHDHTSQSSAAVSPVAVVRPIPVPVKKSTSPIRSPAGSSTSSSPPSRKTSRKSPTAKTTEKVIKKSSHNSKMEAEKKVGKRKGPLTDDQRKQASEIRKLRACLRCKFLKKTCDKGEPCAGCQPSHARLWQVPCTRIDIKEIGYFVKDWKADYERHITLGFSVSNIKGFSDDERVLYITHGYGQVLPIAAREVHVRDDKCFDINWVETYRYEPENYEVSTAKLTAGPEGISSTLLSDYLDRHIDTPGGFDRFIDDYFEGTPFLTQMLKTAFRYYTRTKLPVIRKALKLVLAYNLTLHVTMVEGIPGEENFLGKIEEETSKFYGKTMAPVMINFQIKTAMAGMWRELQKDVLEELSSLYSSVYSGDKLKNWPTIFILASVLLAVWECMQFDCFYRVPDNAAVEKFCNDMEQTPVGVIVGLFHAISQKLPAFSEWDSTQHHHLLNSNNDVCNTMNEVKDHVNRYENYLRGRANAKFDRGDFDCLSNKFLSKLVIRAN